MKKKHTQKNYKVILLWLLLLLIALTIVAIGLGRYFISPVHVVQDSFSRIFPVNPHLGTTGHRRYFHPPAAADSFRPLGGNGPVPLRCRVSGCI